MTTTSRPSHIKNNLSISSAYLYYFIDAKSINIYIRHLWHLTSTWSRRNIFFSPEVWLYLMELVSGFRMKNIHFIDSDPSSLIMERIVEYMCVSSCTRHAFKWHVAQKQFSYVQQGLLPLHLGPFIHRKSSCNSTLKINITTSHTTSLISDQDFFLYPKHTFLKQSKTNE